MNKRNKWTRLSLDCTPDAVEAVENFLFENGCCGIHEESHTVHAYFSESVSIGTIDRRLRVYLKELGHYGFSFKGPFYVEILPEDWSTGWRKQFKSVRISKGIVVKPPWEIWHTISDEVVIDITPRMAFGTGTHESTQIGLVLLEKTGAKDRTVLDIGCGSGILAIAAAKLGAHEVVGIDIDEAAVENAKENIIQNDVGERVFIRKGTIDIVGKRTFDLILANIDRKTVIEILPKTRYILKSNGSLIVSGILEKEREQIENVCSAEGYELLEIIQKGEWMGFLLSPALL